MNNIVGPASMLAAVCMNLQVTIQTDPTLDQKGTTLNDYFLEQIQWGSGRVLGNPNISIATIPIVKSLGQFNIDAVFTTQPEYSYYAFQQTGNEADLLSNDQVKLLFNNDT